MNGKIALLAAIFILAGATYAYRQDLRDAYARFRQGPVPTELTREQALAAADEVKDEPPVSAPAPEIPPTTEPTTEPQPAPQPTPAKPSSEIPSQMNLKVPMVFQAPFRIWDEIHEEACEEAAALMLQAYAHDEGPFTAEEMERRILALVDYQNANYGDYRDSDAELTVAFMRDFLGLPGATVLPLVSADDIRHQVAAGRPVIIPAAGKLLKNPNFRNGGPVYHMLVIKGYRADGAFVTNDPGTRLGENYVYDEATIMAAVHDWNGGDVENGARVMIVVK